MKKILLILILFFAFTVTGNCVTELDYMEYADDPTIQGDYKSNGHHAITFQGTAQLDTTQKEFGASSLILNGNSDYLTFASSDDFGGIGDGDFTIDFRLRLNTKDKVQWLFGSAILEVSIQWAIYLSASNELIFRTGVDGFSWGDIYIETSQYLTTGVWYHIAIVRSGNTLYIFIDGTLTTGYSTTLNDWSAAADELSIGRWVQEDFYLDGWMDEIRISQGTARWTSGFTPSTAPCQTDTYTKLLIHFDGLDEATSTIDSSRYEAYSEDTTKQQGSYSLKGIALITDSLNDTLTRTVNPTIDLTDQTVIKYDIRGSRTGSQIKIGIHDLGGTTSEHTANIASANTWQTETWDISGVSNANKDAIESIIITIVNADAENIFYVDDMYAEVPVEEAANIMFIFSNF